ncbi:UDP-N-acetylmuramoyl-tripeptide--D-alanyl-D-alanine ligase [Spirochaetota bacterium]|nr:UDP-N-acetylmuramoyl-tripeptide--D-alanyl-D-alanine ligase [Spirochaetota bacterium]
MAKKSAPPLTDLHLTTWQTLIAILTKHRALHSHYSPSVKHLPRTTATEPFQISVISDTRKHTTTKTPEPTSALTLFTALKGEHFNGIHFIKKAYDLGIQAIMLNAKDLAQPSVFEEPPLKKIPNQQNSSAKQIAAQPPQSLKTWLRNHNLYYLAVRNPITALGLLAQYKLKLLPGFKIAITGSAGKTSTRHFLMKLLAKKYNVYNPPQNFNNALGVPLSIFAITKPYDFYLFELGMSGQGEIKWLSNLIRPDLTIITSILPAHIKQLKSLRNIASAKAEIFHHQRSYKKIDSRSSHSLPRGNVFYPTHIAERNVIEQQARKYQLKCNPYDSTSYQHKIILEKPFALKTLIFAKNNVPVIKLPACSPFSSQFLALGEKLLPLFALTKKDLEIALTTYTGAKRRLEQKLDAPKIIDDAYNANPTSMIDIIKFFAPLQAESSVKNLIFVLADMLELGKKEVFFHNQLAQLLNHTLSAKGMVFCYGKLMLNTYKQLTIRHKYHFFTQQVLFETLLQCISPRDIVIFKGSNGMKLDKVVSALIKTLKQKY